MGGLLREHRVRSGLRQDELAHRAGLSVRALRNIEQQRINRPRPESVRRLATALSLVPAEYDRLLALVDDAAGSICPRVDLLGPLVVWRGSSVVDPATAMCRRLLGALALRPRTVVPRDELVDLLWGERPPRSAANLLHVYIRQLRTLLEPARAPRAVSKVVVRMHDGYRLDVNDEHVDLALFDQLVARARTALPAEAIGWYEDALALWRGPVLADMGERLRQHPAAVSAGARRLAAVTAAADLALDEGLVERALTWLRAVLADEPLHEGVHARLITALARSGEPAAALRHYASLRSTLSDELGVEPDAEVQAAYLIVLRQERGLAPPAARPTPPRPAQLPLDVAGFTGREDYLDQLNSFLPSRRAVTGERGTAVVISAIAGTAGIGKTALAVHWAHLSADEFPDGQLYVNLRGYDPCGSAVSPAEAVRGFLEAFEVSPQRIPAGLAAQTALYRSLLAGRRVLVVLDNARDAEQVRPLLPGAPGCLVVVTSRKQLSGLIVAEGAHPLTLALLSADEARQLLVERIGSQRVAEEPHATDTIIARCAGLPLALAVVGSRAAAHPAHRLAALAGELDDAQHALDAFAGDDRATDIRSVFSLSYHALSAAAARLFRLLGLHPGPDIGVAAAASLAALPPVWVRPLLDELTGAHLVNESEPGRYTFHDLLRAYAAELADTHDADSERYAARHRLLDHYLHAARTAAMLLFPHRQQPITLAAAQPGVTAEEIAEADAALAWFTGEYPVLLGAMRLAATAGFDIHVWQLAWTLTTHFDRQGHWHDWVDAQQLALEATRRLADRPAQAHTHRLLGAVHVRLGQHDDAEADYGHAMNLFAELGDHAGQANAHLNLAVVTDRQGRDAEPLWHAQQALDLYRKAEQRPGQANALNTVGWYHAQLGDYEQALGCCRQALAIQQDMDDRDGAAHTLDSLGYAYRHLGDQAAATDCYRQALGLYRDLGDRYYQAATCNHLGDAHAAGGDADAAHVAWRQSLTLLEELDHPDAEAVRAKLAVAG